MTKPWWHNRRELNKRPPKEAIDDCTRPGRDSYDAVKYWVEKLEFEAPVEETRVYLKGFGAWSEEELANHEENVIRLFWEVCNQLKEEPYYGVYLEA